MSKLPLDTTSQAESLAKELSPLTTAQLRAQLAEGLRITADNLLRLAMIVRTLEGRGEDLSDLRIGILDYLRRIAYGQLLPEAAARFVGSPMLLHHVAMLPAPDQASLADGAPVKVVVVDAEGRESVRDSNPLALGRDQVSLVFGPGRLRTPAEQSDMLRSRRERRANAPAKPPKGVCRADRSRQGIVVGRTFVPAADVLSALADLGGGLPSVAAEDSVAVQVKLTPAEHRRLKVVAAEQDTTLNDLVRRALQAVGMVGAEPGSAGPAEEN